ncbi:MAG: polyprenyl synthetase family protein [Legionellaceae bacterium]|nr:polyprenyl synthetase family protein [Legionellaceae bacterium]
MPIHRIKTLVGDDLESVNNLILDKIKAPSGLIDELSNHIIQGGGKRLRPLIVILSSLACSYQGRDHILLAAMIEFFHTATLLHDDVVDESELRRGRETANNIWGSKASILVGDFLLTLYMDLLIQVGDMKIMCLLTSINNQITRGEIKQLTNRYNYEISVEEYYDVINSKTSLLFAASASIGAIIAKSNKEIEEGLYNFGMHLGNAFQLIDDALDYCSDAKTIGKNVGDDLSDGKATLPLIYILKNGTPKQKEVVETSIKTGSTENLPEIIKIVTTTNAIEYTKQIANQEVEKAIASLQTLPESIYKDAMIEIAHYATERAH